MCSGSVLTLNSDVASAQAAAGFPGTERGPGSDML